MASPPDLLERIDRCVEAIRQTSPTPPDVALILGSGLGDFADQLQGTQRVSYADLPGFPRSSVVGHKGQWVTGKLGDVQLAICQGRVHHYEGYAAWEVAFPARVLCRLKPKALVVTNAAGGINPGFRVGDFMAITDQINLSGINPLIGKNDDALGPRFPDMTRAYDPRLLAALRLCAHPRGIELREGVYAGLAGPSYETPAEIRMLRTLGADAVGMSTVCEVIAAAHMGVPLAGISCITNLAAGLGQHALSHDEVSTVADQVKHRFAALLESFLASIPSALTQAPNGAR